MAMRQRFAGLGQLGYANHQREYAGQLPGQGQHELGGQYTLTANAPKGWTVTIDDSGNVTATPAPGLQGGTYPIQIIAQSRRIRTWLRKRGRRCYHHAHAAGHDAGGQSGPGVHRAVQRRSRFPRPIRP